MEIKIRYLIKTISELDLWTLLETHKLNKVELFLHKTLIIGKDAFLLLHQRRTQTAIIIVYVKLSIIIALLWFEAGY